jgi:hypothetical protein
VEPDETQEDRARRALQSILSGGDLGRETADLSNEFTDRQSARVRAWFSRVFGRGRRDSRDGL